MTKRRRERLLKKLKAVPEEWLFKPLTEYRAITKTGKTENIYMRMPVPKGIIDELSTHDSFYNGLKKAQLEAIKNNDNLRKELIIKGVYELNKYMKCEIDYDPKYCGFVLKGVIKVVEQ